MTKDENQMELGVYAIYDRKADSYDTPFFAMSDLYAKRRFILMADEHKSPLYKWKEDFQLHNVGHFNVKTGKLEVQVIETIFEGKEIK